MDITKIVGVIIKDRKCLVARDADEDFFKNVGGKIQGNETDTECLKRELAKEIGFEIVEAPLFVFEFPPTPAQGDPGKSVILRCYLVSKEKDVKVMPTGETGELAWVNTKNKGDYKLTPQITQLVLPKLKELGLIE